MKATWAGIAATVIGLTLAAWAGGTSNESVRISMELADGSRLIGTTAVTSVRLVSAIGKIELPVGTLRSVQFNPDRETVIVRLVNNDLLSGVLDLPVLPMQTLFGSVAVPMTQCRSLAFSSGRGDAGLVLHYTFDEDTEKVQDRSGLGHDGVWVGAPIYETGVQGKAARFRSKDTYLVAASPELNMNGWSGMTVSLWVKAVSHTTYGHVINRGPLTTDKEGAFGLGIGQGYKKGLFSVKNNPDNPCPTVIAGTDNLPLNRWCHLAGTYDGEMMRYYVDGKLEKETRLAATTTPLLDGPDTKLVIGNMSRLPFINWGDMFFNGAVDEVRIYKRALSEDEIKQIGDLPK
jgi:hypothetical protein